jgi:hypothetical protein
MINARATNGPITSVEPTDREKSIIDSDANIKPF